MFYENPMTALFLQNQRETGGKMFFRMRARVSCGIRWGVLSKILLRNVAINLSLEDQVVAMCLHTYLLYNK